MLKLKGMESLTAHNYSIRDCSSPPDLREGDTIVATGRDGNCLAARACGHVQKI